MSPWTCPNTKCVYDKQLEPQQRCQMCGIEAEQFAFSELGELWKQKWSLRKSLKKAEENERQLRTMKFCPKCGSTDVDFSVFYRPSIWKCHKCDYEGPFILEDGNVAEEIRKKHERKRQLP